VKIHEKNSVLDYTLLYSKCPRTDGRTDWYRHIIICPSYSCP